MGKYFTRIEESGWAAYIDKSKTNAALYPFGCGNTEVEAVERLENSILVLEDIAAANDYIKLADDEIVVKRADAETLTEWFNDMVPPPWITQACERVRAALEVNP